MSLQLESRPETLTLVRAMISGLGELLSVDPELLDDVKTAVSEACNNTVLHAYPSAEHGPLSVDLYALPDDLAAVVSDRGIGIYHHELSPDPSAGLGMPVIRALAREAFFSEPPEGGTRVSMTFPGVRDGRRLFEPPQTSIPPDGWAEALGGDAAASVSPVELLGTVLGRLARAVAAMARFSLDRFADIYLVTDAVAAHASAAASARRIAFSLSARGRHLELSVGPLERGSGELIGQQAEDRATPSPLRLLSDQVQVETLPGDQEMLRIVMEDRRN